MKIGLDARAVGGRLTGDRTYWRGLISGLAQIASVNEYYLFIRKRLAEADELDIPENFHVIVVPAMSERAWSMVAFGKALSEHKIDVAHVQYTLPPALPCPAVTTVHDISFRLFPRLFSLKDRLLLNISVPPSIRRAAHVITVSESSRKDILTAYPFLASDKITATPLAVSPQFRPLTAGERIDGMHYLKERYSLEGDFVLSVGVLQPRKNLPMLIQAFSAARKRAGFSHKLAIAGKIGWLSSKTESAIADSRDDIVLLGYVPDEDLPLLYACAEVVVYPSLYEGFGLPVLEAMACGCPVIVSDNSSLPEVVGDAGILLPAENVTNWEEAIIRLIEHASLRSKMRTAGLSQATKFSWKETAGKTLDIYHRVARTNEIISNLSKGRK